MRAPERIWAASVTENYGEWQTTTDGLPRPTEYTRSDLVVELAAENERLQKTASDWEDRFWRRDAQADRSEAIASTGAVKIKPLEWSPVEEWKECSRERAPAFGGEYQIVMLDPGEGELPSLYFEIGLGAFMFRFEQDQDPMGLPGETSPKKFPSVNAAKAAAQADYERRILSALAEPAGEAAPEPVAYPKIMYVCEHCHEHNPEMCGHDRTDIYVTPDGRWLCDGCLDEEGVPHRDRVSPPTLYTSPVATPPASAIREALNTAIYRLCLIENKQALNEGEKALVREWIAEARAALAGAKP